MNLIRIDSTASTNSFLKDLLQEQDLPEGTVVVAHEQSAGRGQAGNTWESEPGENLTFSILLRPDFLPIKDYFLLSEVIALSITEVLKFYIECLSVKWPNDIYYRDEKLAGILIENEIQGQTIVRSVIGIGLNVNQEIFRSDAPNPTSLKRITGLEYSLDSLLEDIVASILSLYQDLKEGNTKQIIQDYHLLLYRRKGFYRYQDKGGEFLAQIEQIDSSGHLYLITQEGEQRKYAFKEVKFLH
ncbi:biotin--[acetyl-CoA-carboxylase] ligase [Bacteroidales bacterium OttesenSCG-928-J19]|nr:biotin--[acetyl-CoA-carboxylase] ligase [Bacteroidales bacterium OttesenSCG-928-J19]